MNTCVVGLGFGDEGKGKIVDLLMKDHDICVRYNGGANAGHTVVKHGKKYKFHQLPIGILHGKQSIISAGCVVDPVQLAEEAANFKHLPLYISNKAHIITSDHKDEDAKDSIIGTTRRGIGPCYANKARRVGALRVADLHKKVMTLKHDQLGDLSYKDFLVGMSAFNTEDFLRNAVKDGKDILFESANGIHLDIDHGTYPYVTSSAVGPAAIPQSCGLPNLHLDRIVGVVKCYMTRVGEGPLANEYTGSEADEIRELAGEFGTTTGRPRRIAPLNLGLLKESINLTGATELALMCCDIPTHFDEWKIIQEGCLRVIKTWKNRWGPGNKFDIFVDILEAYLNIPVTIASFGPASDQVHFMGMNCES